AVSALLYLASTGWAPAAASQQTDVAPLVAPRALNPALSALVEQALLRGLQLRAANRYQVAREMRVALETLRLIGGRSPDHGLHPERESRPSQPAPVVPAVAPAPASTAATQPVPVPQQPVPTPAIPSAVAAPAVVAAERRGMSTGCIVATTVLVLLVALLACLVVAFLFTPLRQVVGLGGGAGGVATGPTLAPANSASQAPAGPTAPVPTQLPITLAADAITLQNAATITQTDVITTSHFGPVEYDPTDKLIAVAIDEQVNLRDAATLDEVGQLVGHTSNVFALAWSPDGTLLASGGAGENDVLLWDVATRKQRAALRGATGWIRSVAFSPDGQLVAAGSVDNTIRIWDVATGQERMTLSG
ncbi:MAG TPA: hypothetical protein VFT99_16990, partial [Roseiflexaceae bacterium]|nr:hypothetical protein [Roseiflexaceae bacterium]